MPPHGPSVRHRCPGSPGGGGGHLHPGATDTRRVHWGVIPSLHAASLLVHRRADQGYEGLVREEESCISGQSESASLSRWPEPG